MTAQSAKKGTAENPFTREDLAKDLRALGLGNGDVLHAKVSLRALGRTVGGAGTLLDAMLDVIGPEGTLVSDSFILSHPLPLTQKQAVTVPGDLAPTYAGAFCRAMIEHPDMVRSQHPVQKGVAIGARAREWMHGHTADSPAYDPLHKMSLAGAVHISVGKDVVGVGTTHVAQNLLQLKQKNPPNGISYRNAEGEIALFEKDWVGGCGDGFPKFFPLYEKDGGILKRGKVGLADSVITDMQKTLDTELKKLAVDPGFFFCDNPACTYCRLSWEFSTGKAPIVLLTRSMQTLRNKSPRALLHSVGLWLSRRKSA